MKFQWQDFAVWRNGVYLGTLRDIRQAWQFSLNEYDYQMQLNFVQGRHRRISAEMEKKGFRQIKGVLYRKMPFWDDDAMIVSLGPVLDSELATMTENPNFKIVICDTRIVNNHGIPLPGNVKIVERPEGIDENGDNSFPTPYTRQLAGLYGWSRGHAHIGPEAFGVGDKTILRLTTSSNSVQPDELLYEWTDSETGKVWEFHYSKVDGKIRHYPVPVTRPQHVSNSDSYTNSSTSTPSLVDNTSNYSSNAPSHSTFLDPAIYHSMIQRSDPNLENPSERRRLDGSDGAASDDILSQQSSYPCQSHPADWATNGAIPSRYSSYPRKSHPANSLCCKALDAQSEEQGQHTFDMLPAQKFTSEEQNQLLLHTGNAFGDDPLMIDPIMRYDMYPTFFRYD
jgi:hypothetical protein